MQYLQELGASTVVWRNDEYPIDLAIQKLLELNPSHILISPGPGRPADSGISLELIQNFKNKIPILGVCLGLQAIGEAYGGSLKNLETVFHGIATPINIISEDIIFNGCPKTFTVGRYHSWIINNQNLPNQLKITALDTNGNIMALKHQSHDVKGVQFHPESILSEYGELIIKNWLQS